jgi:hypothetical protein
VRTVRRWIAHEVLPSVKVRGVRLVPRKVGTLAGGRYFGMDFWALSRIRFSMWRRIAAQSDRLTSKVPQSNLL